jgi:quinol monooxygenase YgiN
MLIRIVEMHFRADARETFLELFHRSCEHIRAFEGCQYLDLLNEPSDPCHFFTYSYWENEEALERYRVSELFQRTWAGTKILFDQKPRAWTLDRLVSLPH